jgi:hypothetical protein
MPVSVERSSYLVYLVRSMSPLAYISSCWKITLQSEHSSEEPTTAVEELPAIDCYTKWICSAAEGDTISVSPGLEFTILAYSSLSSQYCVFRAKHYEMGLTKRRSPSLTRLDSEIIIDRPPALNATPKSFISSPGTALHEHSETPLDLLLAMLLMQDSYAQQRKPPPTSWINVLIVL